MKKRRFNQRESSRVSARRKRDHIDIVFQKDTSFRTKSTGFEAWEFTHNALPEVNYTEIDLSSTFLGKRIEIPLLISCMTGGFGRATRLNAQLAEICQDLCIPIGVGSQRQLLDNTVTEESFAVVRSAASSVPVLGNIGGAEVARLTTKQYTPGDFQRIVDSIDADALVIHLNPLQELVQPEGNTNFKGVLRGIALLVNKLSCPVIVKEVGSGLSSSVIERLLNAGVRYVDVAGAGGTSWSRVEAMRNKQVTIGDEFLEWGIPTADALIAAVALRRKALDLCVIASGGIRDGVTAAKAIALGADLAAAAQQFIVTLIKSGTKGLHEHLLSWKRDIQRTMFLTGSADIAALQKAEIRLK